MGYSRDTRQKVASLFDKRRLCLDVESIFCQRTNESSYSSTARSKGLESALQTRPIFWCHNKIGRDSYYNICLLKQQSWFGRLCWNFNGRYHKVDFVFVINKRGIGRKQMINIYEKHLILKYASPCLITFYLSHKFFHKICLNLV